MGPTDGVYKKGWADTELERIRGEAPHGWNLWFVNHHGAQGPTWHAIPPGGVRSAVSADHPDDLLAAIRKPEMWLADELARTRGERDVIPREWHRERNFLQQQLDALEALVSAGSGFSG